MASYLLVHLEKSKHVHKTHMENNRDREKYLKVTEVVRDGKRRTSAVEQVLLERIFREYLSVAD